MSQADEIYEELVKEKSPEFFCDNCGHYDFLGGARPSDVILE